MGVCAYAYACLCVCVCVWVCASVRVYEVHVVEGKKQMFVNVAKTTLFTLYTSFL